MELSTVHMFVYNYSFTGIIKTSYIRDFHILKLKIDFYRILTTDQSVLSMVSKSCKEDPVSPNALKLVSTELIYSKVMSYYESEAFRNYLYFINFRDFLADKQVNQMWEIEFKFENDLNHFKILLNTNEVLRLYNYVNSFYSNYLTNDLAFKFLENSEKLKPAPVENNTNNNKKITEFVPKTSVDTQIKEIEIKTQAEFTEKSEYDDIFNLCLTVPIKSSLIHYTLSYFKYFNNSECCKILVSGKGQVKIVSPILMPGNFSIDETYFRSLILSSNLHINSITFVIKKILSILLQEHEKYKNRPLLIMMLSYLLFIYLMRYFYEVNKDAFRENFTKILCNPDSQKLLFMGLIKNTFTEYQSKVFFEFTPGIYNDIYESYNSEIEQISELYKHLIPLSQEEFADKVFVDLIRLKQKQNKLPEDFTIGNKKVIDIDDYLKSSEMSGKSIVNSYFFDPDNSLSPVENELFKEYKYLDYKLIPTNNNGERVITEAYKYLLNYIKNPSFVLLIKDNKISKSIINLFELLSKSVLTKDNIRKDHISTFYYYNLLVDSLPDPAVFKHSLLLYIVFQIMIPYHYDMYHNTQFIDVFL